MKKKLLPNRINKVVKVAVSAEDDNDRLAQPQQYNSNGRTVGWTGQ